MKLSYSIASTWWRGDTEKALAMISNRDIEYPLIVEKAFAYGKGVHTAWELESKVTGKPPVIFKLPKSFKVIATEQKLHKQLNESDWLVGVIDCVAIGKINGETMVALIDYKSGGKTDSWQVCVYHYLVHQSEWWFENVGTPPTHFMYLTLDKKTKETTTEIIKLTVPEKKEDYDSPDATTLTAGENFILTVLNDIKTSLELA